MHFDQNRIRGLLTRRVRRVPIWLLLLLTVSIPAAVYAATLFSQSFPSGPPGKNVLAQGCSQLTLFQQNNTFAGHVTSITFTCPGAFSPQPAFTVINCCLPVTPHYSLPVNYTLFVFATSAGISRIDCMTLPSNAPLAIPNNSQVNIAPGGLTDGGGYDYCLLTTWYPPSGTPALSISWSQ